ncbi:dihydrolipoyl dehydrogenase [Blattabacterium sp. (Blaberus giganteus)]|uniref:dihydrolipoyl dehydrogenase n=1 Tax=Blattabacterium sp. (Blaberus giganteus) TaxID=1186051 RepID=UPI00025F6FA6|nr:dihydrolipoyl dehydrogenase [Blattabacterium sp. (Blaberus giganteus)]AFJ90850.1 dihydrolipoyl dehydrogenase [Blattabacterium sp. (Blaberus giganteus)]
MRFDVIILGSGPGGYIAAIRAAQLGMKTAVVEKESVGGVCLNWGCIPTKSLLNSAKILQSIKKNGELFGIKNEDIEINYSKILYKSRKIVDKIKKGVLFLMKKNGIHIIYGNALLKKRKKIEIFQNERSIGEYSASHIIIATGAIPKMNANIQYDRKKIITYKDALSLSSLPKKMIIIGSGSIGLEFAYFYHSMGTKVTVIEVCSKLYPNGDDDISDYLKYYFDKIGIKNYVSSNINQITYNNENNEVMVEIKTSSLKNIILKAEMILYAIGVVPNIKHIGLKEIGVQTEKGFVVVDENYRTNINGYYAIGDVIKTPSLAHVASYEAINCIENIKGLNCQKIDYNNVPKCVRSDPEIASVGYTEKESKEKGFHVKVAKFPFNALGRAISDENTDGFVKVIFDDKYDEWLGCHMIGNHVTDLIPEVVVARKLEATSHEVLGSIHPHPSLSESIIESIANAYGKAIHL